MTMFKLTIPVEAVASVDMGRVPVDHARKAVLDNMRMMSNTWAKYPDLTVEERLNGLCFSILAMIDGVSPGIPAIDLVLRPHPEAKEYGVTNGENYFQDGMIINDDDCYLHNLWYNSPDLGDTPNIILPLSKILKRLSDIETPQTPKG